MGVLLLDTIIIQFKSSILKSLPELPLNLDTLQDIRKENLSLLGIANSSSGLWQKLKITHTMENVAKDGSEKAASPAHRDALLLP